MTKRKLPPSDDIVPVDTPDERIREQIDNIGDARIREYLRDYMDDFDFAKVENHDGFANICQGLFFMILYKVVEPRQGEAMLKAVQAFAGHKKAFLEVDFPTNIVNQFMEEFEKFKRATLTIIKPMVSEEDFTRVKDALNYGPDITTD